MIPDPVLIHLLETIAIAKEQNTDINAKTDKNNPEDAAYSKTSGIADDVLQTM